MAIIVINIIKQFFCFVNRKSLPKMLGEAKFCFKVL